MTIGERIAQKRKELGLSQEALGEQLKVSRQAIYKWESDATLPEIEKLVALAKLFSVPVGWLLGVEEEAEEAAEAPKDSGELNETQIRMVEEIVGRYLAAQPQPKKPRRWLKFLAAALVLVVGVHLFNRLDELGNQYRNLQNSVGNINSSVNMQINGIADRVEEILKSQNDLTADYGTEMISADLRANTVTFRLRAVPKTFEDGMSAVFMANSGTGPIEEPGQLSEGTVFSAEVTTALTDEITLSVVFVTPDGQRQTQLLDTYTGQLSESIPWVDVNSGFFWEDAPGGVVTIGEDLHGNLRYVDVETHEAKLEGTELITVADIEVGVFVNQKLVAWAEECPQPGSYVGDWGERRFFRLPDVTVTLEKDDQLCAAVLFTDNYGRRFMAYDIPCVVEYDEKGNGELTHADDFDYSSDIAEWEMTLGEVFPTLTVPN